MSTLQIDSYKDRAVDSNHIVHVGDGVSLPQRTVALIAAVLLMTLRKYGALFRIRKYHKHVPFLLDGP